MGDFLRLEDVSFHYRSMSGETPAVKKVSFRVQEGEFISIVGPSGCGKTTLLSLIAGLEWPDEGQIIKKDPAMPIGYMLQRDQLLEWRTTWQNVMLGPEIQGKIRREQEEQAERLIQKYGLYEFRNSYPSELSGGMRQRVALIRTLMLEPDLLLLDEPFSALDYQTRLQVSDDIWRIIKEQTKTAILITHDIGEAISMADRVLILSHRPGTVVSDIPVIYERLEDRHPFACRSTVEFQDYFTRIWKEMSDGDEGK